MNVYVQLARVYGWTFEEIANMSPYQQEIALKAELQQSESGTREFRTEADYLKWLNSHGSR